MRKLNVLYFVLAIAIGFACTRDKNEPVTPPIPNGKGIVKPSKPNEGKKKEEKKDTKQSNQTKEGFYMLKTIEEYKGAILVEEVSFTYEDTRLKTMVSNDVTLNFTYSFINDKVSKVEVKSSKEDLMSSAVLELKDERASSLKVSQVSYANFLYEHNNLKSVVCKDNNMPSVTYNYTWYKEGDLKLIELYGSNIEYFYEEQENKVYPNLNFILNTVATEDYLTEYLGKRSKHLLKTEKKASKDEEHYSYKFDDLGRPTEIILTTSQGGKELPSRIYKLSYL